jgi:glycosyltransferase involved in cell wall biosynthesis
MPSTSSNGLVVVVPALNEESDIEKTIRELLPVVRPAGIPFEIVAVNDGSTDQTGAVMDRLAAEISELRVFHHDSPRGVGPSFAEVLRATQAPYITLIPGDNAYTATSLESLFGAVGQSDLVIAYRTNQKSARALRRSIFSQSMRTFLNIAFGLDLKDYHAVAIYPAQRLRKLDLAYEGYSYQIEALISLIKEGCDVKQVPVALNPEELGRSRAFKFKIMRQLALTAMRLFFRYQLNRRRDPPA